MQAGSFPCASNPEQQRFQCPRSEHRQSSRVPQRRSQSALAMRRSWSGVSFGVSANGELSNPSSNRFLHLGGGIQFPLRSCTFAQQEPETNLIRENRFRRCRPWPSAVYPRLPSPDALGDVRRRFGQISEAVSCGEPGRVGIHPPSARFRHRAGRQRSTRCSPEEDRRETACRRPKRTGHTIPNSLAISNRTYSQAAMICIRSPISPLWVQFRQCRPANPCSVRTHQALQSRDVAAGTVGPLGPAAFLEV